MTRSSRPELATAVLHRCGGPWRWGPLGRARRGQRTRAALGDGLGALQPLRGIPPLVTTMLDATGKRAPRLCLLPTGDETDLHFVDAAERAFSESAVEVTCLRLFPMPNVADPAELVCSSDAVFVGGGSVANMLAVWRVHALDVALRAAWERGVTNC